MWVDFRRHSSRLGNALGKDCRTRHGCGAYNSDNSDNSDKEYVSGDLLRSAMEGFMEPASSFAFVCGPNDSREGRPGFCDDWAGSEKRSIPSGLSPLGFLSTRIYRE